MASRSAPLNLSNTYDSRALLVLNDRPEILWWIKNFSIPDITISQESVELMNNTLKLDGTKVAYGNLSVTCFLDEEYQVYKEAYRWLVGKVELDNSDGAKTRIIIPPKKKTDASIVVYNNSMQSQVLKFLIRGMQIESIDGGEITVQGTTERTITMQFVYDSFDLFDDTNTEITGDEET